MGAPWAEAAKRLVRYRGFWGKTVIQSAVRRDFAGYCCGFTG
jgi:hypothetical protein